MMTATKTAPSASLLRVLLVGDKEEDFYLIRDILGRASDSLPTTLNHAHSLEEAEAMARETPYGLILFQHEAGKDRAVRFLAGFLHHGRTVPYIVLTENADEAEIANIIQHGRWNYLAKSQLDGSTLIRTIQSALTIHSLQDEREAAEESLRKLSQAVEHSADTIVVTNRQGSIEYVNPAFETLTGYSREEIRGKTPRILKSGEQGPETYREIWKTILSGNVYRGILVNRKKNGELYYVEESISPVRDAHGHITHFIANGRDLTERMRLEAQLVQAQKMDAIGRLAGGVAHDFNNLLTIITSYSELALDEVEPDTRVAAKIQEVLLAARRAAELTRQLLAFSRKQPHAPRLADLNGVITRIIHTLPRLIGEDIECSFIPGQALGRVRIDPVQVEQILMNLACNSRDAMPRGGHLRIQTANVALDGDNVENKQFVIAPGKYALITVSDDGEGIPAQHLPHIFEPFYTTKAPGQGTGLGLATVYGIVKQNKGFICADSQPGVGSTFKIYLPCVEVRPIDVHASAPEGQKHHPAASGTILLVEDEPAVRRATAEFLTQTGYTTLEAKDGRDALSILREHTAPIRLVLTDVVMPNLNGSQLADEVVRMRPGTQVLFVSGYAGKNLADQSVLDLERNFLQKPYTLQQLSEKIGQILAH
jgi:two-component system cell cycle sensor histidine kinase/response regulator CckA